MNRAANAAFERSFDQESAAPAALLASLQAAHRALTDCLDNLEELVATPSPAETALSRARFMMSQASYARRQLVRKVCCYLSDRLNGDELEPVRSLQREEVNYMRESTAHVQRWSISAAIRNWPEYQQASRLMRSKLRDAVRTEQRLLYPLLSRCELQGHLHR